MPYRFRLLFRGLCFLASKAPTDAMYALLLDPLSLADCHVHHHDQDVMHAPRIEYNTADLDRTNSGSEWVKRGIEALDFDDLEIISNGTAITGRPTPVNNDPPHVPKEDEINFSYLPQMDYIYSDLPPAQRPSVKPTCVADNLSADDWQSAYLSSRLKLGEGFIGGYPENTRFFPERNRKFKRLDHNGTIHDTPITPMRIVYQISFRLDSPSAVTVEIRSKRRTSGNLKFNVNNVNREVKVWISNLPPPNFEPSPSFDGHFAHYYCLMNEAPPELRVPAPDPTSLGPLSIDQSCSTGGGGCNC